MTSVIMLRLELRTRLPTLNSLSTGALEGIVTLYFKKVVLFLDICSNIQGFLHS